VEYRVVTHEAVAELRAQLTHLTNLAFGEYEGAPVVEATPLKQAEDGSLELGALDAEVQGSQARYESDKDCVGFWTDRDEYVTWPAQISRPGVFEVEVTLGHAGSSQDNLYVLSVGDQELTGTVPTTGSWTDFTTVKLGRIEVREAGVVTVQVRPAGKARGPAMNLRQVKLTPAR